MGDPKNMGLKRFTSRRSQRRNCRALKLLLAPCDDIRSTTLLIRGTLQRDVDEPPTFDDGSVRGIVHLDCPSFPSFPASLPSIHLHHHHPDPLPLLYHSFQYALSYLMDRNESTQSKVKSNVYYSSPYMHGSCTWTG